MPERYHCLTVKAVFNKVFISRLAVCTIDGKVKIQEFKRNNIPKYTGLVSFLSKWGGRPLADWGPNSFGDNLIWVGRRWQGQIWKSFKYVDRHLDLDRHHYHWRSAWEEKYFIRRFEVILLKFLHNAETLLQNNETVSFLCSVASHPISLDRCLSGGREGRRRAKVITE